MNSNLDERERSKEEYARRIFDYRRSIFNFLQDMWGLSPQPVKKEYKKQWDEVCLSSWDNWERLKQTVKPEWFGDWNEKTKQWDWYQFHKGKHVTWQQSLLFMGIDKANNGDASKHISVVSGHGIGKSMSCSVISLWFLYCYYGAQVPVTAPTSHQMKDVLWKEMSIWIKKMPQEVQPLYQWSSDYVRMAHDPESWFARARTSTKENTEAIAGVHADHVCLVVDEASGIPEQVYTAAEGALTSGNVLVVLISNGTRTTGYFFDTHHKRKHDWQTFQFDGEHSPIVDREYVEMQEKRHGRGTDEFRIRVSGGFPTEDAMDDSGYLQLIASGRITVLPKIGDTLFVGRRILGVDPSGEGKDETTFVVRDHFHAEVVHCERTSNPRAIAERILTFMARYKIQDMDVVVGSLGVGTDVGKEVALASVGKFNIYTVLEGNQPSYEEQYNALFFRRMDDEMDEHKVDLYLNLRSLMHFRARKWLIRGGTLIDANSENSEFVNEIISNKYKRSLQGNKIQMMPKSEMSKLRIKSPNKSDAFCLTFLRDLDPSQSQSAEEIEALEEDERRVTDRFAVL